jgi:hypothetical protein
VGRASVPAGLEPAKQLVGRASVPAQLGRPGRHARSIRQRNVQPKIGCSVSHEANDSHLAERCSWRGGTPCPPSSDGRAGTLVLPGDKVCNPKLTAACPQRQMLRCAQHDNRGHPERSEGSVVGFELTLWNAALSANLRSASGRHDGQWQDNKTYKGARRPQPLTLPIELRYLSPQPIVAVPSLPNRLSRPVPSPRCHS